RHQRFGEESNPVALNQAFGKEVEEADGGVFWGAGGAAGRDRHQPRWSGRPYASMPSKLVSPASTNAIGSSHAGPFNHCRARVSPALRPLQLCQTFLARAIWPALPATRAV